MKYIFSLALLLFATVAYTQDATDTSKPLSVIRIIKIDSLNKDAIYHKSMLWCAEVFKDNRQAINLSNKETGLIVGKGSYISDLDSTKKIDPSSIVFDWKIEIKDYKAKFSVTDIDYMLNVTSPFRLTETGKIPFTIIFMSAKKTAKYWENVKAHALKDLNIIIDAYALKMNEVEDKW